MTQRLSLPGVIFHWRNTASTAAYNLDRTNQNLQRSLNRLSTGSRINSAYDDAGGLAVSMKLSAAIRRSQAVNANVENSLAFLQTQDGVLKTADKVLSRMSELTSLALDVTKNASDIAQTTIPRSNNSSNSLRNSALKNLMVSRYFFKNPSTHRQLQPRLAHSRL